jgi:hypothetical protein
MVAGEDPRSPAEAKMRLKLQIEKDRTALFEGTYEVTDAESFGKACAEAWTQLRVRQFGQASSVGALMETLNNNVLDALDKAHIRLSKA